MPNDPFVIVGASLAGARAAAELREQGHAGPVIMLGAESERPYERPPLSKDYLRGEAPREQAYVHPAAFYEQHEIELRLGVRVVEVEPLRSCVVLEGGAELRYERLLLATGSEPRLVGAPGSDLDGVCYLRTFADCDALRERLAGGGPVAIIGAGWIGMEVAASARQLGAAVTVIAPEELPLAHMLGPEAGRSYADLHREHGVELMLGRKLAAFEGDGRLQRVRASDGQVRDCALAVVGIGASPRIELAAAAGIETGDGVLVDAALATSAPAIHAAGDIANAWHPFYERRIRVEHWANAREQGPAAARAMLGLATSYDLLPFFFSDQYDVGMEYRGDAAGADRAVLRGDPQSREYMAFWLADGAVRAAMNVNVWDVGDDVERLIRSRRAVDERLLADPDVPLSQLAGGDGTDGK